jgi:Saxitoxin biosynthesis operon protein SxtJ
MKNRKQTDRKSLRSFGLILGGVFSIIAFGPMLFRGENVRGWFLGLAGCLIFFALAWPKGLEPVYKVWMLIGRALGWVNSRIILAIGFYGIFTPISLVMRVLGKDPMRRKFDPVASSYKVVRIPRPASHMKNQY